MMKLKPIPVQDEYLYAIRIYENNHFGRVIGNGRKNLDYYNGSFEILKQGKWVFDLRGVNAVKCKYDDADVRKLLGERMSYLERKYLGYEEHYDERRYIAAQLFQWDMRTRRKEPAIGVVKVDIETQEFAWWLALDKGDPFEGKVQVFSCPEKEDKKRRPVYFMSNYDVADPEV